MSSGKIMYDWAKDLYPIHRSITGKGVRQTLNYIKNILPELNLYAVKSNKSVFDWKVPKEWEIKEAYIEDEFKNRIIDIKNNNLHIVSYSHSIDKWMSLDELQNHLFSLPDKPNAIPYVTSYYSKFWGFCLSHNQRSRLIDTKYHVVIKSTLFDGQLDFGEIFIPGKEKKKLCYLHIFVILLWEIMKRLVL